MQVVAKDGEEGRRVGGCAGGGEGLLYYEFRGKRWLQMFYVGWEDGVGQDMGKYPQLAT